MCFGMGGFGMFVAPANEKARKLGIRLQGVALLTGILAVLFFVVEQFLVGIINMVGATIAYLAVRNPEAYNIQSILCFTFLCFLNVVQSMVRLILVGLKNPKYVTNDKLFGLTLAVFAVSTINSLVGSVLAAKIYEELRTTFGQVLGAVARQQAYDPYDGQPRAPVLGQSFPAPGDGAYNAYDNPHMQQSRPQGGFKAFSGQGHRLGGT